MWKIRPNQLKTIRLQSKQFIQDERVIKKKKENVISLKGCMLILYFRRKSLLPPVFSISLMCLISMSWLIALHMS